jgi:transposase
VTVPAETAAGRVIAELATELDRDFARRAALGKEIEEAFHSHPFGEILASLPGIGPRTGARILAEIGDSSGFASGAKLAAYAGLAPVTGQSGTSLNAEIRSRRGNHQLKNAMFLAAFASLRDPASTFPVVEGRRRAAKTARAPNQPGPVARQWMPTGRMRLTGRAGQCP